jgi:hypothetical protein
VLKRKLDESNDRKSKVSYDHQSGEGKQQIWGCPFFNQELTDPEGKNITQGYP